MEHCIKARAAFVISPCCYGFIQNANKFTFPRSKRFQDSLTYKEHMILCRFADQTAVQLPPERRLIGKHCMGLVDLDRSWAAETHGYSVQVMTMEPESCSPKNNMLVGKPEQEGGPGDCVSQAWSTRAEILLYRLFLFLSIVPWHHSELFILFLCAHPLLVLLSWFKETW